MDTGSSLFASVIEDHLELKRRNARLDKDLPLNEFAGSDPFENHPLFKTEEQARREELETGEHPVLELPQETLEIPALPADEDVQHAKPRGWMETTASQEFSWE
jgi:hypothetical protein